MGQRVAQVRRLMSSDERIGMGFNSESGLAVGTPFDLDALEVEADPDAPGQRVLSTITIVNSHEELMETMGMSMEAQGRYGFFSGALKAQFASSTKYNSTSTFLMAKVIVQNPLKRATELRLTEEARKVLDVPGTGVENFTRAFGDSFVRGLQSGGEFYAVMRITSMTTSSQSDLAVELEAEYNGLAAAGSFMGKFQEAKLNETSRAEFSATVYQRAGAGEDAGMVTDVGEVLARVKAFPRIVEDDPVAYEVEVATYDTLPLPLPVPEEEDSFLLALRDARERKLRYVQTRNDLEFARSHPEYYEDLPDDEVLLAAMSTYTQLISAVMDHGIELATGRMKPPRMFDAAALPTPLAEPAPIVLKRVSTVVGTVRVPDVIGEGFFPVTDLLVCLQHGGGLNGCLDGTAFPGQDDELHPIDISRDVAEFINLGIGAR